MELLGAGGDSKAPSVEAAAEYQSEVPRVPPGVDCCVSNDSPANNTRSSSRRRTVEQCTQILNDKLSPQHFPTLKHRIPFKALEELFNSVLDEETGKILEYRDLLKHPTLGPDLQISGAHEFGRLAQ